MRLEWDKVGGGWERVGEDEKGMGEIRKRMEGDWRERVGGIRSLPLCLSLSHLCSSAPSQGCVAATDTWRRAPSCPLTALACPQDRLCR